MEKVKIIEFVQENLPYISMCLVIISAIFISKTIKLYKKNKKYSVIEDANEEALRILKEAESREKEINRTIKDKDSEIIKKTNKSSSLDGIINSKKKEIEKITSTIDAYSNDLELIENGIYEPIFDYETSEEFKLAIISVKEDQKRMISENRACSKPSYFTVDHSEAKGRAHIKRVVKLALRSFNNECEALISRVRWNNIETFATRMYKSAEMIDKLNSSIHVSIKRSYVDLKIKELKLTHERELKLQKEKEEQKAIRDLMKEEERARREHEAAVKKANDDEARFAKMLELAMSQAKSASGNELNSLQAKIDILNSQLEEAHAKTERAKSRAQLTKAGHVYVISNIGSFGEDVYKIGLTRRLDPMDRVKELGDASVPFSFDVHAMIYSEDAPSLEKKLHKAFSDKQVNKVNSRKEFFNVSLSDIQKEITNLGLNIEFTLIAEAKDYRESLLIKSNKTVL